MICRQRRGCAVDSATRIRWRRHYLTRRVVVGGALHSRSTDDASSAVSGRSVLRVRRPPAAIAHRVTRPDGTFAIKITLRQLQPCECAPLVRTRAGRVSSMRSSETRPQSSSTRRGRPVIAWHDADMWRVPTGASSPLSRRCRCSSRVRLPPRYYARRRTL